MTGVASASGFLAALAACLREVIDDGGDYELLTDVSENEALDTFDRLAAWLVRDRRSGTVPPVRSLAISLLYHENSQRLAYVCEDSIEMFGWSRRDLLVAATSAGADPDAVDPVTRRALNAISVSAGLGTRRSDPPRAWDVVDAVEMGRLVDLLQGITTRRAAPVYRHTGLTELRVSRMGSILSRLSAAVGAPGEHAFDGADDDWLGVAESGDVEAGQEFTSRLSSHLEGVLSIGRAPRVIECTPWWIRFDQPEGREHTRSSLGKMFSVEFLVDGGSGLVTPIIADGRLAALRLSYASGAKLSPTDPPRGARFLSSSF